MMSVQVTARTRKKGNAGMSCDCSNVSAKTAAEQKTLPVALGLNVAMFVVGSVAAILAQSTGILADALDMLTDAAAYALALMAITRGPVFKANAARWSGWVLVLLGIGIMAEVGRRWFLGSEPAGLVMLGYSVVSFAVNLYVLVQLTKYRRGEVHLRRATSARAPTCWLTWRCSFRAGLCC